MTAQPVSCDAESAPIHAGADGVAEAVTLSPLL
jgi:hypothetical protein